MVTMDPSTLLQSPFAPLTFVVAPTLLTNASSVLALSTVNRMVRAHDRMHSFFAKSEAGESSASFAAQGERVAKQAALLLGALQCIYIVLARRPAIRRATL